MAAITSTGLGSGLDINSIVTAIVDAEKDPALGKIMSDSAEATAKISAYGILNSELSTFKDSYQDLGRTSAFSAATSTSSDSSIVDATLSIGAQTGSWEFEVLQRAEPQTIVSPSATSYDEVSSEVGTGTITFTYGTYNDDGTFSANADKAFETLTIDPANNSLGEMRDAINEGDYSVSASIINDGSDYRLVLTNKETGAANALEITVVEDDGDNSDTLGLSSLTYSAGIKNMDSTSTAQDAKIVMDGITITRDSNEISSVIEGVTLNINGENIGKTVSLSIAQDTSGVEEQLNAFVENYNNTITQINSLTLDGGDLDSDGALNGESTVRNIQNQLRSVLNTRLTHIGGAVQSFADLGFLTNRDGTLSIDETLLINDDGSTSSHTRFTNALANHMDSVANFFTASGAASDSLISFESNNSLTVPGSYDVEVTQLATQGSISGLFSGGTVPTFPLTLSDTENTFTMRLDGFESGDIELSAKQYDNIDDLMTELQLRINSDAKFVENGLSVEVSELTTGFGITSNSYGTGSTVAFLTSELSSLGLGIADLDTTNAQGLNVEGKIDGNVAYSDGQYLLSQSGDSTGLKILVEGGTLDERGQVTYAAGMYSMMNDILDGIIDTNISSTTADIDYSGSTIDGKLDSLNKVIALGVEQQESLTYKMDNLEARLYSQFNAMDIAVSSLNNTMSYLQATLDALPGYTNDN